MCMVRKIISVIIALTVIASLFTVQSFAQVSYSYNAGTTYDEILAETIVTTDFTGYAQNGGNISKYIFPSCTSGILNIAGNATVSSAAGQNGAEAIHLKGDYNNSTGKYPTIRMHLPSKYRFISHRKVVVCVKLKLDTNTDRFKLCNGFGLGWSYSDVFSEKGKYLSLDYEPGIWYTMTGVFDYGAQSADFFLEGGKYTQITYAGTAPLINDFCSEGDISNPYVAMQLHAYTSGAGCTIEKINMSLVKEEPLYGKAERSIFDADFSGLKEPITRLDSYMTPSVYAPFLDNSSAQITTGIAPNGTKALKVTTNSADSYPSVRFYLSDKNINITDRTVVLEMEVKLLSNTDKLRLSEGWGIPWSESNIFNSDGKFLNLSYSANRWYRVTGIFDYPNNNADFYLNGKYAGSITLTAGFCPEPGKYCSLQFWSAQSGTAGFVLSDIKTMILEDSLSDMVVYTKNGEKISRIENGTINITLANPTDNYLFKYIISALVDKNTREIVSLDLGNTEIYDFVIDTDKVYDYELKTYIVEGDDTIKKIYRADILSDNGGREIDGHLIMNDILAKSGQNVHPRLMLTSNDFDRIRANKNSGAYKIMTDYAISLANSYLAKAPLEYNIPDGIRLLEVSRGVLSRVKSLSLAYQITQDSKYAKRAYDELANAAAFSDWNPYHFLDVAEMSEAFAIGYDWLYDYMDAEQKKIVRDAIVKHAFGPIMDDYTNNPNRKRSYKWYQDSPGDNWKYVCSGGVGSAVLAIFDEDDVDKELCADILSYGFSDMYDAVRNMYMPDGSYTEGFTYWVYASNYLAYYSSALCSAAGVDYGLTDYDPVRRSAYYVKYMCSNSFNSFNFGDAEEVRLCYPVFSWYGKNFKEYELSAIRNDFVELKSWSGDVDDLLWYNHNEYKPLENLPLQYGSVGGANASFRSGWATNDLYAAIHFGENDAYHGQADTGTFVIEYGGKRFFSDLGQDNYNVADYSKAYRYRAEGHNTLVINPSSDRDQALHSRCYADRFVKGKDGADSFVVCNISDAYFGKGVTRGMKMTADCSAVIVQDKLELDASDTGYWFAHTKASIKLSDDRRGALLDIGGVRMWAQILSEGHTFSVMNAEHLDSSLVQADQRDNSEYKKLAISFGGANEISVAFIPLEAGQSSPETVPAFKTIGEW